MPVIERHTLPNVITVGRIALAPIVAVLLFIPTFTARLLAFVLFLIAAFSDLWDGYLARKHGWISDFGKLVDPIADKLLLIVTFVPFYILSHGASAHGRFVAILPETWEDDALTLVQRLNFAFKNKQLAEAWLSADIGIATWRPEATDVWREAEKQLKPFPVVPAASQN